DYKVEGELTNNDPKDKKYESPSKVYPYKMMEGKAYVITMDSKEIDSIVRVEDADGKELAEDDDGGGYPNAKLVFKCMKDGEYKIRCISFPVAMKDYKTTGKFTLTIREATKDDLKAAFPHDFMIGQAAPDVVGEFALNGKAMKLSDLKGKVVMAD